MGQLLLSEQFADVIIIQFKTDSFAAGPFHLLKIYLLVFRSLDVAFDCVYQPTFN